jgi:hypothetical protein
MPKILTELYECKLCGFAPTNKKDNYEKHMRSLKHKQMVKPDLAKQLADLKREKKELKLEVRQLAFEKTVEVKQLQFEKEQELEQLEADLKEKIKEETIPERVITQTEMVRTSQGIEKFQEKLINMFDELQDYSDLYNGVKDFQEIFKRDFSAVYEEDKVCVIDKYSINVGYWINNAPSYERFYLDDRYANGLTCMLNCVTIYHKALKKYAGEAGFKTEYFKLEEIDKKELEEWVRQEITWIHSNS